MKREFIDPSTTTEADRALRLRKDLAAAQAKLREAEQWREQAAKATRLERELADVQAKLREAKEQNNRLSKRPSPRQLQEAEEKLAVMEARLRNQASKVTLLERELADAQAKLREAEQQAKQASKLDLELSGAQAKLLELDVLREQASKASKLERELADAQAKLREAEEQVSRLSSRPSHRQLQEAQEKLRGAEEQAEKWREQASKASRLEREAATLRERVAELEGQVQRLRERPSPRQLQEAEDRAHALEARLRERPAPTPRHVERCAQAKLNRRLFQENERLKQEARDGL